jgi:predicted DNA binding protein
MWVLRIKVDAKKQLMGSIAVKHNISIEGYPLSYYKDKKGLYLNFCGFVYGEEKDKKAFFKELEKRPEVIEYEMKKDFGIGVIQQPLYTEPFWSPRLFWINPIFVNPKEAKHIWHLGSFDRNVLEKILKLAEKNLNAELLKFKEEKLANISITKIRPNLTEKQKKALDLAMKEGYYEVPRKTELRKLAKARGIAFSTFQVHLRKAEEKILSQAHKEL